jgi:hypothetical protein
MKSLIGHEKLLNSPGILALMRKRARSHVNAVM